MANLWYGWYGQPLGLTSLAVIGLGIIAGILAIVIIFLKGYTLWHSAKRGEKWWFIALLIVNTAGILELVYIFFVLRKHRR
jgi:type IV secretory pathway TrbD component